MRLKALVLSVALAALGVGLAWLYTRRLELEVAGGPPIAVLTITRSLEPGTKLSAEHLAVRAVPMAYVEARAVRASDRDRVLGLRVATTVAAQQSLLWTDVALASDEARDMSSLVQPGMRAVSIRAEGKGSTLVRSGDRVDLIGTFPKPGSSEHRAAVVLVQNVLVMARGGNVDRPTATDGADLTLSLSVANAQLVAVAAERGRLSVALRNPDDVRVQEGLAEVSSTTLLELERRAAARAPTGPTRVDSR